MGVYWFPEEPGELTQRPRVAGPVQAVQPAIGARGEHLATYQRRVSVIARLWRLWHGAHVAPALPCFSSAPTSENPGEARGRR